MQQLQIKLTALTPQDCAAARLRTAVRSYYSAGQKVKEPCLGWVDGDAYGSHEEVGEQVDTPDFLVECVRLATTHARVDCMRMTET